MKNAKRIYYSIWVSVALGMALHTFWGWSQRKDTSAAEAWVKKKKGRISYGWASIGELVFFLLEWK